jgi:hypothetical protein
VSEQVQEVEAPLLVLLVLEKLVFVPMERVEASASALKGLENLAFVPRTQEPFASVEQASLLLQEQPMTGKQQ